MHELRRPYGQARSIIRKPSASDAYRPRSHKPLVPGQEREASVPGLPSLQLFEVVSKTDD